MKMKSKLQIVDDFQKQKIDILITTSIIEVVIDFNNLTCLIVHHPERFGIAQLHQLRGRIARNNFSNDFVLDVSTANQSSLLRLAVLFNSTYGEYIAKKDLEIRGSGDFFGIKQAGNPDFGMFNILIDQDIAYQVIGENQQDN